MSKIFISGSTSGLGLLAARVMTKRGHAVHLHARSESQARQGRLRCPEARGIFVADLASADATKRLAAELNAAGPWDAVIHNASHTGVVGRRHPAAMFPWHGPTELFAVNTLAPYLLTCLVRPPARRYVFLASSMHRDGDAALRDVERAGFADTKLHSVMLARWFARHLNEGRAGDVVECCSVDPGISQVDTVNTPSTSGHIVAAVGVYVNHAEGRGAEGKGMAEGNGRYWSVDKVVPPLAEAEDEERQDQLVELLKGISGVSLSG
ncbi:hypothetical protein PG999_007648 [Apiospora kogelbergensis]|uniref:Short-chain dehydrogenase n=1 Tax=Apiospora kogelbergensis TaxID=1337665 RepID=A0AAW0QU65_9PEZI